MFGKSIFQSVLDRLEAEDQTRAVDRPAAAGIAGLNGGFAFDTAQAADGDTVRQAYADMAGPIDAESRDPEAELIPPEPPAKSLSAKPLSAEPPSPEPPPAHLTRLTPAEIAADLALTDRDTPAMLGEKRRAFAAANHPDRFPRAHRPAATTRMTIANMLVDEALRRLKRGPPRKAPDARSA